ncbi:hypothetical protein AVEN_155526-1 [Araneus ventricosus]|uniref:Tc1-like transposase DDE domain-containing protein n=1 Tax=Araneus ventricosus TaxID=182803 RepID=A0A4Y2HUA7_ARAVE|nr:hypothetical protein AVEN_155526-1 [Araneus ventricosus]
MLSDGVILLHDNTHTARKTRELLQKFKWEIGSLPSYNPDLAPNLGFKHLSGTMFSSNSDVKTAAVTDSMDRDVIYQTGLNKLVLHSGKCLIRFGDYAEK